MRHSEARDEVRTADGRRFRVEPADRALGVEMPDEFEPRKLAKRTLQIVAVLAVVGLVRLLAPGLGEVRDLLSEARPSGLRWPWLSRRCRACPMCGDGEAGTGRSHRADRIGGLTQSRNNLFGRRCGARLRSFTPRPTDRRRFHDASTAPFGTCASASPVAAPSASEAASCGCPRQDSNLRPAA
jgi:hypothetical protein